MDDIKQRIKEFAANPKYKKGVYALKDWKTLQSKPYPLMDICICIYNAAGGSFPKMDDIIQRLTAKRKLQGRSQMTDPNGNLMDIRPNENGVLELYGNDTPNPIPLKGQHMTRNPKMFRKGDQVLKKNVKSSEEKIFDLGQKVRELYVGESNTFITLAMYAIRKYAGNHKINVNKVVDKIQQGKLVFDEEAVEMIPNTTNDSLERKGKTIVITESSADILKDMLNMTEYKFNSNIKHFIGQLLQDPVNAQVPLIFKANNINRSTLLSKLIDNGLIVKKERLSDKDENGEPKTVTMMVRYQCPKKNFDRNLKKLFIKMFEKNLPQRPNEIKDIEVDEATGCGGGGAAGGAFVTAVFPVQRRTIGGIKEATDSSNSGQYTVPFPGDEETLARHNGKGGSVSVNFVKK
jgi:hypothetical protein